MSFQIYLSINALNGIERLRKSGEKQILEKLGSLIDERCNIQVVGGTCRRYPGSTPRAITWRKPR